MPIYVKLSTNSWSASTASSPDQRCCVCSGPLCSVARSRPGTLPGLCEVLGTGYLSRRSSKTAILWQSQSPDLSNSDQHQNLYSTILHRMARRVSSEGDRGNGAGIWALRVGDPPRVAPAAGLRGDGGAGTDHLVGEQGQAEAALAFAASIVESSDDAIVGMTLDGMITSWNAGAERLYGYTAREVIGRWPIGITVPEDEQPKILKRVGRVNGSTTTRPSA